MIKKNWLPFVLAFVLPMVLVFWWWGGFNRATIVQTVAGPYHYVYAEHIGDYSKIPDIQIKVADALRAQGITPGAPITILYDDPRTTLKSAQRAHVGYLLGRGVAIKAPLQVGDIAARPVLEARVQASMLLAPSTAYQALHDYLKSSGKDIRMPTVEIYVPGKSINQMGVLTVEMPI